MRIAARQAKRHATNPVTSIYVIGFGNFPVKIGMARNPAKRLMELQIGCPDRLAIHHLAEVPSDQARRVESACHKHLAEQHRVGEWFNVTVDEAAEIVDRYVRICVGSQGAPT